MRTLAVAILTCALAAACGDNLKPESNDASTDAPEIDAAIIDATIDVMVDANCPSRAVGAIGGPCTMDTQCDSTVGAGDGFCLNGPEGATTWPAEGYCIRLTECTTDNECGAGNQCVRINDPAGAFNTCLPSCGAGSCACPNGQLCASSFTGSAILNGDTACLPGNASAVDGDPCVGFGECAQDSLCLSDSLENPGGQCARLLCTVGMDNTCAANGDGHCIDFSQVTTGLNGGTVCVDRCTTDTDCRQADGYECFDAGGAVGRYCRHPQAGDPCAVDTDCGNAALWDCKIGLTFPGGMCTPTTGCPTPGMGAGCSPTSSLCYDSVLLGVTTDNVCVDRCGGPIGMQGGCRAGYVCRDIDPAPATTTLGCVNP